jgi:hypothetical protein
MDLLARSHQMSMDGGGGPAPITAHHVKVIPRWPKLTARDGLMAPRAGAPT